MKPITMMILPTCPHCVRALDHIEQLKKEHPEYNDIEMTIIDESAEPDRAKQYDYWYVPTFFVDGEKIHEGVIDPTLIDDVFEKATK